MGQGMVAQAHLPVHTAQGFWGVCVSKHGVFEVSVALRPQTLLGDSAKLVC